MRVAKLRWVARLRPVAPLPHGVAPLPCPECRSFKASKLPKGRVAPLPHVARLRLPRVGVSWGCDYYPLGFAEWLVWHASCYITGKGSSPCGSGFRTTESTGQWPRRTRG